MSGALISFAIRVLGVEGSIERAEVGGEVRRGAAKSQLERALQERSAGHLDEAFNLLSAILRREPEHLDASLAFWDVANDLGRPGAAAGAILRVVRDQIRRGDCANAVKHWLELVECGLDGDAEPALLIRMATMLRDAGERQAAVRALRNALLRAEGASSTAMASRVAREASELDPRTAAEAAWRALGSVELDLQERQNLENLLAEIQPSLEPADDELSRGATCEPQAAFSAADLSEPEPEVVEPGPSAPEARPGPIEDPGAPETRPDPIELEEGVRQLEAIVAVPTGFDSEGLLVEMEGGAQKRVRFDRIEAVSVAAVDDPAARRPLRPAPGGDGLRGAPRCPAGHRPADPRRVRRDSPAGPPVRLRHALCRLPEPRRLSTRRADGGRGPPRPLLLGRRDLSGGANLDHQLSAPTSLRHAATSSRTCCNS